MKNLGYRLLKFWIKSGLHLYYGRIGITGLENVPKSGPVLFLPNHQGALMDVLLLVTDCNRKPYFLTRSDVFVNPVLNKFFSYLRMLPIYRIRDGRDALKKNRAVFDECARLFHDNNALVLFPEANHNLQRRVRPMSKGFTRILFNTFDKYPELDVQVIPVGMNYRSNTGFPDKVAVHYGTPISVKDMYEPQNLMASVDRIKTSVSKSLKGLTTHIEETERYTEIVTHLDASGVDYLNPKETNAALKNLDFSKVKKRSDSRPAHNLTKAHSSNPNQLSSQSERPRSIQGMSSDVQLSSDKKSQTNDPPRQNQKSVPRFLRTFFKSGFILLNLPIIAIWRVWIRPKVWEPEFTGTLRFGFALLAYPLYYLVIFVGIAIIWNLVAALAIVFALFTFNSIYVRYN